MIEKNKTLKYFLIATVVFFSVNIWAQEAEAQTTENEAAQQTTEQTGTADNAAKTETAEAELDEVVVTATREQEAKKNVAATIGSVKMNVIRDVKPTHPAEIVRRVPGVHINTTSGEGHLTAIRHPLTTSSVYLFLEDGIPTRSAGFFNHNAMYEVNVPQSGGIEILKGPGTALYGSDALGGVINVLTNPVTKDREIDVSLEGGQFGWMRGLVSYGQMFGTQSIRVDANVTKSDGWQDSTEYQRQSGTIRHDAAFGNSILKTVVTASNIKQQTAGTAALSKEDYEDNPTANYVDFAGRDVQAVRASVQYDHLFKDSVLSLTPFMRYNRMYLFPNWGPNKDYVTKNMSYGMLAKHRVDFDFLKSRLVAGADFDFSPGTYKENKVNLGDKDGNYYTTYKVGDVQYDYDVAFLGASPFAQYEFSPVTEKLRLSAGARFDYYQYDYDNKLSDVQTGFNRRPADTKKDFQHFSPKAGIVYNVDEYLNIFTSYRHAFRVPGAGDLFTQGNSENTVDLQPVKVDSYELGFRGSVMKKLIEYDLSAYYMQKKDDIVSYKRPDPEDSSITLNEKQNAGETLHQGIELGLGLEIVRKIVMLNTSFSYAEHTYEAWSPKPGEDYSGNKISFASDIIGNITLKIIPIKSLETEFEWVYVGKYFMDDENIMEYPGHSIFNFRCKYDVTENFGAFVRMHNLANEKYAERAAYGWGRETYAPGLPFTVSGGITYTY
ncbi:MAG: TonB-dependent receptor [Spirochaetia bacterium]|nr:TonB-dependent receptor [Spirochaetia bacterium]